MADPAKPRATYDDLLAVPDHLVAEIIGGILHTHPRPASLHARAASRLGAELDGPFDRGRNGPGGWLLLDEPELHLHGDVLVPDIAGWRRTRMPELPDAAAFELAPDWICEVLSPSTATTDRAEKLPAYAREGVGHAWLVDPIARTLEAHRLEAGRWLIVGTWRDDAKARVEPFDAFELDLAGLWAKYQTSADVRWCWRLGGLAALPQRARSLLPVHHRLDVVPVRVQHERAVILGMVVRPHPRRPEVLASGLESRLVKGLHLGAAARGERDVRRRDDAQMLGLLK